MIISSKKSLDDLTDADIREIAKGRNKAICESRDRPVLYRGYELPAGMTPACFDEIANLLNRHQMDDCEESDAEGAIKIFRAIQSSLK